MAKPVVPASMKTYYDSYHFAPAVIDGDHVRCSGMLGTGADGSISDDPETQFRQAFDNLKELLSEAGSSFDELVEMTTFHVGLRDHLAAFMKVKDQYVTEPYPAWTAIGVSELAFPGALVEVRVTTRRG